ncbi:MAG: type I restriction enzyme HsdR N-terminal domain-containing protein [Chlamydiales bacterium]
MMATMDSCSQSSQKVYDPIRKIWVSATPEELVRQQLLLRMTEDLGYPKELLAIEKELSEFPHLKQQAVPQRRIDILCFGRGNPPSDALYPLLLIECKKEKLTRGAKEQLLGYNSYVGASFVAACAKDEVLFGYRRGAEWEFLTFLPPYVQLLASLESGRHG